VDSLPELPLTTGEFPAILDGPGIDEQGSLEHGSTLTLTNGLSVELQNAENDEPALDTKVQPVDNRRDAPSNKPAPRNRHSRDSAISLDEEVDEVPLVRPRLRRGERFTLEHVLLWKQEQPSQATAHEQSVQTSDENHSATLTDNQSPTPDENPKPRIHYPLPNNLTIRGRTSSWPKQSYREQPPIADLFPERLTQIKRPNKYSPMYEFFRRHYMCQSPVNDTKLALHAEGLFQLQREHAGYLTQALKEILKHEQTEQHEIGPCCKRYLPRALYKEAPVPKDERGIYDKWFGSVEEAMAAMERNGEGQGRV
jgi:hypothetical protein